MPAPGRHRSARSAVPAGQVRPALAARSSARPPTRPGSRPKRPSPHSGTAPSRRQPSRSACSRQRGSPARWRQQAGRARSRRPGLALAPAMPPPPPSAPAPAQAPASGSRLRRRFRLRRRLRLRLSRCRVLRVSPRRRRRADFCARLRIRQAWRRLRLRIAAAAQVRVRPGAIALLFRGDGPVAFNGRGRPEPPARLAGLSRGVLAGRMPVAISACRGAGGGPTSGSQAGRLEPGAKPGTDSAFAFARLSQDRAWPGIGSSHCGRPVRARRASIPDDVLAVARPSAQVLGEGPRAPVVGGR